MKSKLTWIFDDSHRPPEDDSQLGQVNLLEIWHLGDDKGVVLDKLVPSDDREIRENFADGREAGDTVEYNIGGHFLEVGERQVSEVSLRRVVY